MYTRAEETRGKDKARQKVTWKTNKGILMSNFTLSSVPRGKCLENNKARLLYCTSFTVYHSQLYPVIFHLLIKKNPQATSININKQIDFWFHTMLRNTFCYSNTYSTYKFLYRATKILLYNTLIRPILVYGVGTGTMTKKEEKAVIIF